MGLKSSFQARKVSFLNIKKFCFLKQIIFSGLLWNIRTAFSWEDIRKFHFLKYEKSFKLYFLKYKKLFQSRFFRERFWGMSPESAGSISVNIRKLSFKKMKVFQSGFFRKFFREKFQGLRLKSTLGCCFYKMFHHRFLKVFWICLGFWIYQGSEYVRVLNIPFTKYKKVLFP